MTNAALPHAPNVAVRVVFLVEHMLVGETIGAALRGSGYIVDVADILSADAVELCRRLRPDVLVVDVDAIQRRRWHLLPLLNDACQGRLVALSSGSDPRLVAESLDAGATGFVSLEASLTELEAALTAVHDGESVVSGVPLKRLLAAGTTREVPTQATLHNLTMRELDILARLARGESTSLIARELGIAVNTARTHIQNLMGKLDVHSRLEAAAVAAREGIG